MHRPLELVGRHPRGAGKIVCAQRFVRASVGEFDRGTEAVTGRAPSTEVRFDGYHDDGRGGRLDVVEDLGGEEPTDTARLVGDDFDLVANGNTCCEQRPVLRIVRSRQVRWEQVVCSASDHLTRASPAGTPHKCLIGRNVSAVRILHAEHHMRKRLEDVDHQLRGRVEHPPILQRRRRRCTNGMRRRSLLPKTTGVEVSFNRQMTTEAAPGTGPTVGPDAVRVERAVELAGRLLTDSRTRERNASRSARSRRARMVTMVSDDAAKEFTLALTDQVTRITDPTRAADRFARLVRSGVPRSFGALDRLLLRAGGVVATRAPRLVMPMVVSRLRRETAGVILPAEDPAFARHIESRAVENVRCNVNVLGESIVGEDEAASRLRLVRDRLARSDVDYVSVKISAITSHVSPLAFDATVAAVADRLRTLYREAMGHSPAKFVNLDMEEYRDLELTVAVFRAVLDEPEFLRHEAGIVLQAYLPDVHSAARQLAEWALGRRARGGAGIKVRVVKGANLAMESVEAELRGWEVAPYPTKADVDASYKAALDLLLDARFDDCVRVGLASHNLFDVAWGLVLRDDLIARGVGSRLEIEMLEGMAEAQSSAVRDMAGGLLLYTPVVAREDFPAAIAYLVRRLDENTAPQNFLRQLFDIEAGNAAFEKEASRFRTAVAARNSVSVLARRTQDRAATRVVPIGTPFSNEADTDFALARNRAWITEALDSWRPPTTSVDAWIDGERVVAPTTVDVALTCSPWPSYAVSLADASMVERAVQVASRAGQSWSARPPQERAALVHAVGDVIAGHRGAILATMAHDAGKTIAEGDPEVSEAVDFARYYAANIADVAALGESAALGTVVIAPPWNFPYAIPIGGVLAALAAGNAVILKPAPQTVLTTSLVAQHCWEAGIPRDVLQFLPCPDDEVGQRLITHEDVDAVILTGAHATAELFLGWRPSMRLHAETSGKNMMLISASADVDAAIKDLVRSAFGHAGQKCSAASLAVVDASLYDSPVFRARLRDAVTSLRVGPAHDLRTDVGPLIDPASGPLRRGLTTLDPGESWLVEPKEIEPRLWTPGVRIGVEPGCWFHRTECFGPVLGLLRANDFDHAIELQNATDFGLTAGLHALDPTEIDRWIDHVEAGNLYINRGTTGAIVRRQPFGGWKQSVVGPTVKTGGPRYVQSLRSWPPGIPTDAALRAYQQWSTDELYAEHDPSGLRAESNSLRFRPLRGVALRVGPHADAGQLELARAAASAVGARLVESVASVESDDAFAARMSALGVDRVRLLGENSDVVRRAAHAAALPVDDAPVSGVGAVELPRWLREQAVSRTLHRHGHLPEHSVPNESPLPGR